MEGFFCGIFYLMYQVTRKYPSVKPAACQLPFQGSLIITSPERGGEPAKLVEGFLWNLLLGVKDLRKNSSVSLRLPAQHKARPSGALSGEPIFEKGSQTKRASPTGSLPCRDALFQANRIYFAAASFSARFSQTFARSTASYKFGRSEVLVIAFTGSGSLVAI